MTKERIVAMTTISHGWKISLNKEVRKILEKEISPLKIGDKILYILNAQDEIVLRKA